MRAFIVIVVLLAVGIGITGFVRGWYTFSASPEKIAADRDAVVGMFKGKKDGAAASRDEFQKQAERRLADLDRNLKELKDKSRTEGSRTVDDLNVAIARLDKETQSVRVELKELLAASDEAYEPVRVRVNASLDALKESYAKAASRFE